MRLNELYGEIVVLMTYCATADVEYLSSNECANRFKNVLETIKQYKDIEKELGIELITLYKCFKSTKFYVKNLFNEIIEVKSDIVKFDMGNGYVYFGADYCSLSSYGKTWALTREELGKKL